MKKILFLFSLLLCVQAYGQASHTIIDSGDVNETVRWTLDSDSTLTISGEGEAAGSPWCNNNADKIKQIIVSEGITSIAEHTTCGNYNNVSSVQLPNSLKTIGYAAIGACEVKSVTIPENVATIEALGFYKIVLDTLYYNAIDCNITGSLDVGLKVVFIGEKVTRIPKFLFVTWSGLEKLTVSWKNPSDIIVEEDAFKDVDKANCKLIVPAGTKTLYEQAEDWKDFDIVEVSGASDNADLRLLEVESYTPGHGYTFYELTPTFSPDITEYAVDVPYSVTNVVLNAFLEDNNAKVNGKAKEDSQQSDLSVGENIFTFSVTAEDGVTQKTYTVVVNRGPSTNANLSSIFVDATYDPFEIIFEGTMGDNYYKELPYRATFVCLNPYPEDSNAKVSGDQGCIDLQTGYNTFNITVTAKDGITQKTYTVVINRAAPSTNADLLGLNVSAPNGNNVELTPAFSPNATNYAASVP
ncbi:MAG: cadherin-like beta sandwich domain-containing protein, partial [Prevotellaceae bacterium]|nr:cadherin-like beta sandwich domain-containing protein [Prevotellaceae bacterium]